MTSKTYNYKSKLITKFFQIKKASIELRPLYLVAKYKGLNKIEAFFYLKKFGY